MIADSASENGSKGWIFNIQKFSLHDGAGIRTLVFMKGCPLACTWCSNPESQAYRAELLYARGRCIGASECDRCIPVCKTAAIGRDDEGKVAVDRTLCDNCGECARVCPSKALELSGTLVSVDDVIRTVEQDGGFYVRSGGGLTVSGGEPLAQDRFVENLLAKAQSRGLDTAIETSGLCRWEALRRVAPHADQIFYDIKCIDARKHRDATGASNDIILENFRRLRREFPRTPVVVRTPIVPGLNDSTADIEAIARFIDAAGGTSAHELLAYHGFGEPKYDRLGRSYPLCGTPPPSEESMAILREAVRAVQSARDRDQSA
ncbi:MAG: glycyl-radical enzyme activating protein [Deltaproteobacteria bacterium]|nr:glycyl-radical enzyme activating protein [Deltaproteobacteria bacterium]